MQQQDRLRTGFNMEMAVFPKQSGKTNTPVGCREALGVTLFPSPRSGDFKPRFPKFFLPPPWLSLSACSPQAGGWVGTGFRQAQLHLKRLSLQTKRSFPRREPSTSHLLSGAAAFPVDIPTRPRNPCVTCPFPQASTSIQREPCSIVHLQHLYIQPGTRLSVHPLFTATNI